MTDKTYNVTLTERELLIAVFALAAMETKLEDAPRKYDAERIAAARFGELAAKLDGLLTEEISMEDVLGPAVKVTEAPIADAPKVEGAECIANFTLKTDTILPSSEPVFITFDPSTVKRNPFYFGNSTTCTDPLCKGGCGTIVTEPLKLQADEEDEGMCTHDND
jgi:hypothetical protein